MDKNTCRGIFQERSDAHALERRDDTVQIVTRSKQAQQGRTKESQQHGCRSIHPRSIGKDINGQSEKESPQHQLIPGSSGSEFQYKVNVEKGSSISGNMYVIQNQHLKKYQPDKPSDSMYIGNYYYFTALFSSSFCSC